MIFKSNSEPVDVMNLRTWLVTPSETEIEEGEAGCFIET